MKDDNQISKSFTRFDLLNKAILRVERCSSTDEMDQVVEELKGFGLFTGDMSTDELRKDMQGEKGLDE